MVGCLFPAVCIAACMNVRSPFLSSGEEDVRRRVNEAKVYTYIFFSHLMKSIQLNEVQYNSTSHYNSISFVFFTSETAGECRWVGPGERRKATTRGLPCDDSSGEGVHSVWRGR